MYRKDYILRLITLFAEAIGKILGLIKEKKFEEASETIKNAYLDFLQKEAAFFSAIPKDKLTQTLLQDHNYTNDHLEILAHLFFAEAEFNYKLGRKKECLPFIEKALLLFEFINKESKTFSQERVDTINQLKNYISQLA